MALIRGTKAARSWVRLGLVLLLVVPAMGVKPHRADITVSARVVRHTAVRVKVATATRASLRRPAGTDLPVLAVQSNGPTRRIEQAARAVPVDGQSTPRRVVTIFTP